MEASFIATCPNQNMSPFSLYSFFLTFFFLFRSPTSVFRHTFSSYYETTRLVLYRKLYACLWISLFCVFFSFFVSLCSDVHSFYIRVLALLKKKISFRNTNKQELNAFLLAHFSEVLKCKKKLRPQMHYIYI